MKILASVILVLSGSQVFAVNCDREEVSHTSGASVFESVAIYAATGIRIFGGVTTVRPEGQCRLMNDAFMDHFENDCALAFEEKQKSHGDDFRYSCYQETTSFAFGTVDGDKRRVEFPSCFFCEAREDRH